MDGQATGSAIKQINESLPHENRAVSADQA